MRNMLLCAALRVERLDTSGAWLLVAELGRGEVSVSRVLAHCYRPGLHATWMSDDVAAGLHDHGWIPLQRAWRRHIHREGAV